MCSILHREFNGLPLTSPYLKLLNGSSYRCQYRGLVHWIRYMIFVIPVHLRKNKETRNEKIKPGTFASLEGDLKRLDLIFFSLNLTRR